MADFSFHGLNEYIAKLEEMRKNAEGITKKALYEGAGIATDALRAAVEALPTDNDRSWEHRPRGITERQKAALAKGLGIAPFQTEEARIHTLVGFSGYSDCRTKKYPNGQPLALIARIAESGTSFSYKTPFVRKAIRCAKPQAEARMKEIFEGELEKIMKEE